MGQDKIDKSEQGVGSETTPLVNEKQPKTAFSVAAVVVIAGFVIQSIGYVITSAFLRSIGISCTDGFFIQPEYIQVGLLYLGLPAILISGFFMLSLVFPWSNNYDCHNPILFSEFIITVCLMSFLYIFGVYASSKFIEDNNFTVFFLLFVLCLCIFAILLDILDKSIRRIKNYLRDTKSRKTSPNISNWFALHGHFLIMAKFLILLYSNPKSDAVDKSNVAASKPITPLKRVISQFLRIFHFILRRNKIVFFAACFCIIAICLSVYRIFTNNHATELIKSELKPFLCYIITTLFVLVVISALYLDTQKGRKKTYSRLTVVLVAIIVCIFLSYFSCLAFSHSLLKYIPFSKGGFNYATMPKVVLRIIEPEYIFNHDPNDVLWSSFENGITEELLLIRRTPNEVFVAAHKGKKSLIPDWRKGTSKPNVISIPKDNIGSINYINK